MNSLILTFVSTVEPENTPDSARTVGKLTYSRKTTDDFRFNTKITWSPPTHSCPPLKDYLLLYGDDTNFYPIGVNKIWFPKKTTTVSKSRY